MKTLKVGIIGAGGIAKDVHIPSYLKLGDKVEIVAIADVAIERAQEVAIQFGVEHVYGSYEEMLANANLDAVSICVPNKFHVAATLAALEAGCHVLCEKPPAMNEAEATKMMQAATKNNKILTYGFHFRHSEEVKTAKRFIDAGEFGNIYAVKVQAMRRRGIPGWGVFTNKELQGGGPLIDIGVHMLDVALYLMDYPEPESLLGKTHQQLGTRQGVGLFGAWDHENFTIEDMAVGMITFKNGASLIIETSFAANVEQAETMNVSLNGSEGGADIFPLKMYQEKHDTLIDVTPVYLPVNDVYKDEIEHFVDCCLFNKAPLSTAEQGVIIQKIIDGIYESAAKGKAVNFN